ncbi:fungal-specific transcription factor domain-containing protein [Lentinula detonsa]|uniref:Fungal-specific transcription factor domain-containing protein n=1 Tax=Lentinula detonsa TaxID=2804962 RepID=A0A9W8U2F6_9AGAR|nr:fungal-specific transcription factor domain-containing protein [Lentinula detonsa]
MFALDEDSEPPEHKRPRLPNACNNCRLKKIKCDSAIMPRNICSNCIAYRIECTRELLKKKRGPRLGNPRRSIHTTVDAILSTRRPFEVPKDPMIVKKILVDLANHIKVLEEDITRLQKEPLNSSIHVPLEYTLAQTDNQEGEITEYADDPAQFADGYSVENLTQDLKVFGCYDFTVRHYGDSSTKSLVQAALDVKKVYTTNANFVNVNPSFKRQEFWSIHPWQKPKPENPPPFKFPPDDLMIELIDLYFTQSNPLLPLLHRPSFLRSVSEGLHLKDRDFGALVLAVCAFGARFSNDVRVQEDCNTPEQSSGWKWIRQIRPMKQSFEEPPSLHEIQLYTVYILFMCTTTTPEVCWVLISTGIRLLQDVGAHRRRSNDAKPSVETESWKRAFWFLYSVDNFASTLLGRPRSTSQNDCDAGLPIDCDDEYWEQLEPELEFQQPPGKPSTMSYWICFLKLMNIADLMLHTLLAVKQSDMWSTSFGLSKQGWNEKTLSEIDSLLNKWVDEIPEHLKWDPNRENIRHFNESVVLYTTYYGIQIVVHRPFIPHPGEDHHSGIPSLAICANAARSCLHIIEVQQQRKTNVIFIPGVMMALFNSAIVLLVNMWRGKHFVGSSSSSKELADVYRAINTLHLHEKRWDQAGRLADILDEVISISHFNPSPQPRSSFSLKRRQVEDNQILSSAPITTTRADKEGQYVAAPDVMERHHLSITHELPRSFDLPLNTNDLGSLPIYQPFDWSVPQAQSLSASDETQFNSWASTMASDTNQFGLHAKPLSSYMDLESEEHSIVPSQSIGEELPSCNSSVANDLDDWASYIATIDEILQATNTRVA